MKIKLPLPDQKLNPNRSSGNHWAATRALRDKAKSDAYYATKEVLAHSVRYQADAKLAMVIEYILPDARRRDADNLLASSKSAIDGIAQALELDDSRFNPITIKRSVDSANQGMVVFLSLSND